MAQYPHRGIERDANHGYEDFDRWGTSSKYPGFQLQPSIHAVRSSLILRDHSARACGSVGKETRDPDV